MIGAIEFNGDTLTIYGEAGSRTYGCGIEEAARLWRDEMGYAEDDYEFVV